MSGLSQLPPSCCRSPPIISFLLRFEQVFPDLGSALLSVQLFYFDNINHSYLLLALRVKPSAHFLTHHAKTLLLSWIFFTDFVLKEALTSQSVIRTFFNTRSRLLTLQRFSQSVYPFRNIHVSRQIVL